MSIQVYEDANFMRMSLGDFGFGIYDSSSVIPSEFYGVIHALEETEINFSNFITGNPQYDVTNLLLPSGLMIFGNFKDITVINGKIIAYKRG
jgi:hypothetical protein